VPDVVVGALFGVAGLHRQHLLRPVQRLNLRLLIHTEDNCVLRWCEIQPDDVNHLGFQLGVGGELERIALPGPHPEPLPRLRDRHVVDLQLRREQPARPVSHPQPRRRWGQGRGDDVARIDLPRPSGPFLIDQPVDPTRLVAVPPSVHRGSRHPDPIGDLAVLHTIGMQQLSAGRYFVVGRGWDQHVRCKPGHVAEVGRAPTQLCAPAEPINNQSLCPRTSVVLEHQQGEAPARLS